MTKIITFDSSDFPLEVVIANIVFSASIYTVHIQKQNKRPQTFQKRYTLLEKFENSDRSDIIQNLSRKLPCEKSGNSYWHLHFNLWGTLITPVLLALKCPPTVSAFKIT